MRPDLKPAIERVAQLRVRMEGRALSEASLREIEEVLTDGYALALDADAWSTRTERRLRELIGEASHPARGRELRSLGIEHGEFKRCLVELRHELAQLHREHARLLASAAAA